MRVGFDEVGRGALAGPVVVSLVATPDNWPLNICAKSDPEDQLFYGDLDAGFSKAHDSKKLTATLRQIVSTSVTNSKLPKIILGGSNTAIDTYGIGKVLTHLLAIGLELISAQISQQKPLKVYIDGRIKLIKLDSDLIALLLKENELNATIDSDILIQQMQTDLLSGTNKFILIREDKADAQYLVVALASNVAKVYRDTLMQKIHLQYPDFGWHQNVGYGTKSHREAIIRNPTNELLRHTWLKKILS